MAMVKKGLLVVESPTKARTIGKYLGESFEVVATVGHFRDLPTNKMGVDTKTWEIDYVLDPKKKEVISQLLAAAKKAKEIYIASDPDREGEAIAFHVKWLFESDKKVKSGAKRITFHEITKEAVEGALKEAREIDMDLVNAQQGRRVLDRVVGYSLSPVLWKKVRRGLSAGRVQSVAVRLIVEREKEREGFKKEPYFKVAAQMEGGFEAELTKIGQESFIKTEKLKLFDGDYSFSRSKFGDRRVAEDFVARMGRELLVTWCEGKEILRTPLPALTTSKMQQAAARRFGWSGKQTMSLAQRLYEQGLITYHRTDSVNLSEKAVAEFAEYIGKTYGQNYVAGKARVYKNKSKNAQEAHEAIRPTRVGVTLPEGLDSKELRLYELIWRRAVATQAAAARLQNTRVELKSGEAVFEAGGVKVEFEGFLRISQDKHEDQLLPEMKVGDKLRASEVKIVEAETNPPPRYSDASLVAALEKQGIGRPSTYAPIISTIIVRQYVEREEGRFVPTALGRAVTEFLVTNFKEIMSLPFTAEMEEKLDKIADGAVEWQTMMGEFWKKFEKEVKVVEGTAERVKVAVEKTGEKCPECKEGDLVIRVGRFGKFISCSRFPECKYKAVYREDAGFACPTCGAPGVVKRTRAGRKFFGCSRYPECKWAGWKKP